MILNTYALLSGFVALLRLGCAAALVALVMAAWRAKRTETSGIAAAEERRLAMLAQLAMTLLAMQVVSWPLLYLLLQSYVPEWPGVMCIYGVTQVGAGSDGLSRFLPQVLLGLQFLKPTLIFLGGIGVVLASLNRQSTGGAYLGRWLAALLVLGLAALAEALLEGAYLIIPKREEYLAVGCCTTLFGDDESRFVPAAWFGALGRDWLERAYYAANGGMVALLGLVVGSATTMSSRRVLTILASAASVTLAINFAFLREIAAPALLRLPHHHCPYDLVTRAPEAVLAVAAFLVGAFAVGWACTVAWCAHRHEPRTIVGGLARPMLVVGLFAHLGSFVMLMVELLLADGSIAP